jgi:hypothetical protein
MSRIFTLLLCCGLCFNALAKKHHDDNQGNGNSRGHKGGKKVVVVKKKVVVHTFSNNDRDVIIRFFEGEHKRVPPGQAKKLRHFTIVVGAPAAPEVVKVFTPLPPALIPLLPPPPPGFEMHMAGDQIVRIDKKTRKVVDCVPVPLPPSALPPPPPLLPVPPPPPLPR